MYNNTAMKESGLLNNYGNEPEMYYADYPSEWEQRRYVKLGALGAGFVVLLLMTSAIVTSIV